MSVLSIMAPLPMTISMSQLVNGPLTLTPDPKEAASKTAASGSPSAIKYDFGAPVLIDTVFVGFSSQTVGDASGTFMPGAYHASAVDPYGGGGVNFSVPIAPGSGPAAYPRHFLWTLPAPVTMRSLAFTPMGPPGLMGVVAAGLSFRPTWGHEYGSGRFIGDTGSASRNFAGGFAIDDGVATTGWQWTLGDLSDAEREALFQIVKSRRQTRSVLVVEDTDVTAGLHERIHWGLFDRLEGYERDRPGNNRWGFRIEDWV